MFWDNYVLYFSKHPHTCGVNPVTGNVVPVNTETSPHMWGKQALWNSNNGSERNIPTHVG
ncbi:hypothetical protein DENIS_2413 [Desulfonema ishimotonii]|uniref:Uncharacterized protein n=1 Tax=Desulfonema ishimotonii TaxID=45657 RepID=A0A401FWY5_9BACT|nr:hypothetical protein DENIS_2413 [Desulfonema ishimotonii]